MTTMTADLCDEFGDDVQVADAIFRHYGAVRRFSGPARTLRVSEDNSYVRDAVESPGDGQVLVVDGGGSRRSALLGGRLAELALKNGWAGVIVNGCVRDRPEIDALPLAVLALQTMPRRTAKRGQGERDVTLRFAGVEVGPGSYVYADEDGWLVAPRELQPAGTS